jgi:hypothetical protein
MANNQKKIHTYITIFVGLDTFVENESVSEAHELRAEFDENLPVDSELFVGDTDRQTVREATW